MKRLVWLLLFAFGTALAQVSPVDVRVIPAETCGCCEQPGACGMADCLPPPAPAQPVIQVVDQTVAARSTARRAAPAPVVVRERFYVQFLPRASASPAQPVRLAVAPRASVPLFREHCSLLL